MSSGSLFVVSAPSGAGKTTLCRKLLANTPDLIYSVSYTTRNKRPGEEDGRDYFFISQDLFRKMIGENAFLEYAEVFDRHYGTGRSWVEDHLKKGRDVLVDVDILGARQIRANFPEAILIFIVPPNMAELNRRLYGRRTESEEELTKRLGRVREEVDSRDIYDFLVVNDELETAAADLIALVRAERLRMSRAHDFWTDFFDRT